MNIIRLPDICLALIFQHLSLRALARCRRVCNLFQYFADKAGVHDLVVGKSRREAEHENWCDTERPIKFDDSNRLEHLQISYSNRFPTGHTTQVPVYRTARIRRIKFRCSKRFSSASSLGHLDIRWTRDSYTWNNSRKQLTLSKLRVLRLTPFLYRPMTLNTPSLKVLRCGEIAGIELEQP